MKKILILAPADNPHTIKWVNALSDIGHQVILFGLGTYNKHDYVEDTIIYTLNQNISTDSRLLSKLKYLKALYVLKFLIKKYQPDILHAHYATSYGLLSALLNFHSCILSVWGTDIYVFPRKSLIYKLILKYSLSRADMILSTSYAMKKETQLYTSKEINVLPFGVDTNKFKSINTKNNLFDINDLVIGTVKSLEKVYGIEYLLKAFKIVYDTTPYLSLKLLIVGRGREEEYLKSLSNTLGISKNVIFTGYISPSKVIEYHNIMDIEVFMSLSESFGVSVLEASACEKPVIVSNIGGLPEVVDENITGFIVESQDYTQVANILRQLLDNPELCKTLGKNGRRMVKARYNWEDNVQSMSKIYESFSK